MKYVILSDSDNVEPFIKPRQLERINGEVLIKRTIRILKENGVEDILITSHDKRFDNLGATRYEPLFNDYKPKENKGYWLSAFPIELLDEPITFLLGDVYYSDNAIKTIVESKTNSVLFFCTDKILGYDERYIKHHDEPLGFKVEDYNLFKEKIYEVKKMKDKGLTRREPIAWELYRAINGLDINVHKLSDNYIAINDETCDIDRVEDILLLEYSLGGNKMIRLECIKEFTLKEYNKLTNIIRKDREEVGRIFIGDIFECDKDMADYLTGKNKKKEVVANVIKVIPEEVSEEVVQAVANAIVEEADEQGKEVKDIVEEIVEESKEEPKKKTTRRKTTNKKTTKK